MIETQLIESSLSSLFDYLNKKVVSTIKDKIKFDFIIKEDDGKRVAIEVKENVTTKTLINLRQNLQELDDIDVFYLITAEPAPEEIGQKFKNFFKDSRTDCSWLSINEFLEKQNLDINFTNDLRDTLLSLQVAAVTSKFNEYNKSHIGSHLGDSGLSTLNESIQQIEKGSVIKANLLFGLRRQFPYKVIAKLEEKPEDVNAILKFGNKYEDAIIILTDIKNFSSIVSVSDPEELNDLMSKYYSKAKELVFTYGGILDKFIGDAVLAIFNYPFNKEESYRQAMLFCGELILMGEKLFSDYQKKLDQEIETGTRVGLATGPIYALNIGVDEYEITFIGDKINFAARLEKNCELNGVLISNRFINKLLEIDSEFAEKFDKKEIKIDPKDAKGQIGITTAWQVERTEIEKIFN